MSQRLETYLKNESELRFKMKTGADVEELTLPRSALRLLMSVLAELGQGNSVALTPIRAELTTQQAAELLGVSRPHLVKLLEQGALPFRKVGAHRRVKFSDLAAYRSGGASNNKEPFMKLDSIDDAVRAIANGEDVG